MKSTVCCFVALLIIGLAAVPLSGQRSAGPAAARATFSVPVEYFKLPNGLRVVLSPDHSAPTVIVAV